MSARRVPGVIGSWINRPPLRMGAVTLGLVAILASPIGVGAWGVPGCSNLPAYNRALGALQGMTSACDMSVEEARRVVAAHDGVPAVEQPAAPPPRIQPPVRPEHPRCKSRSGRHLPLACLRR